MGEGDERRKPAARLIQGELAAKRKGQAGGLQGCVQHCFACVGGPLPCTTKARSKAC